VDDPRRRRGLQPIEQQRGEQEVAEVIDPKWSSKPIAGDPALTADPRRC